MKPLPQTTIAAVLVGLAFSLAQASADEGGWRDANEAYRRGDTETGNRALRELLETNPGDIDLAVRCLQKIYEQSLLDPSSPWTSYALDRLASLERLGALSAAAPALRQPLESRLATKVAERDLFVAVEEYQHLAEKYPHDLYWRAARARAHHWLGLRSTRDLFEALKEEADPDHPDPWVRERWERLEDVLSGDFRKLPQPLFPPAAGSPLVDLEPDDPDGRWLQVAEQPIDRVASQADRLIGIALLGESIVPWRDMSGLIDPPRALDLHLRNLPPADLDELRRAQSVSFSREKVPARPDHAKALALYRRYPWAEEAQRLLLAAANRELFAGRSRSALRSFEDLLAHGGDSSLTLPARTGRWVALATLGERAMLEEAVAGTPANAELPWMGATIKAGELGNRLLESARPPAPEATPLPLEELEPRTLRIPAISPWLGSGSPGGLTLDMRVIGDDLMVSSRNHLAVYPASNPTAPRWSQNRLPGRDDRGKRHLLPGRFLPEVKDGTIYARWGYRATPQGIAAFDQNSGKALWSIDRFRESDDPKNGPVPIGDPVISDGLLYVPLWSTQRGNKARLACIDLGTNTTVWERTIAEAGRAEDLVANLERSREHARTFGNRVTLAGGAIYVSTNAGMIARCDPRDGRADWLHFYKSDPAPGVGALGCAPVVAGDRLVCLPRDTGRAFALDPSTGRLLWDNPLVLGLESLGVFEGTLIVRGQTSVSALDLATGEARWHTPVPDRPIGRAQRIGTSIYLGGHEGLVEIDARDGLVKATRKWDPGAGTPLSFHIANGALFRIGEQPAPDMGLADSAPLNPGAPDETAAPTTDLEQHWSLARNDARVTTAPTDGPLSGLAYVYSEGILECIELTPKGAVRWRRFVNARDPQFHVFGDKLLVLSSGTKDRRIAAFGGLDGTSQWEGSAPRETNRILACGDVGLLHDGRATMVAIDANSGERLWQRRFDLGRNLFPRWDGTKIDLLRTAMGREPQHLVLEPKTGRPLATHDIRFSRVAGGDGIDGRPVADGYHEVRFDPVEARYFRLVMLSEVNGGRWSSAAELQIAGEDGANLDRSGWRAHYTDSFEPNARMDTRPERVFDGDRTTWWHSQWLNGIPPHPHELQIDLGARTKFSALRYLPAVIINNNGMIGDYELYVSDDAEQWGEPVAKGTMIAHLRIDRATYAGNGMVIEARNARGGPADLFYYPLDGGKATSFTPGHRMIASGDGYVLAVEPGEGGEKLVVLRPGQGDYRFELGKRFGFDHNRVRFAGGRLFIADQRVLVADLENRQVLIAPEEKNQPHDRRGFAALVGDRHLIKFYRAGRKDHEFALFDLTEGTTQTGELAGQTDELRDLTGSSPAFLPQFGNTLLLRDDYGVSAWSAIR